MEKIILVEGVCKDHEKISDLSTAVGFTASKIRPTGSPQASGVLVTVEDDAIRYLMDGTTPTVTGGANEGHLVQAGSSFVINNPASIGGFRAINAVNANGAKIVCSYFWNN